MGPPRAMAHGEGDNYLFTQLNPPKPRQDSAHHARCAVRPFPDAPARAASTPSPETTRTPSPRATPSTFSPPRAPAPADPAAQGPRQAVVRRQRLHLLRPRSCLTSLVLPPPPRGALRRHRDRRRADHPQRGELAPPTHTLGPWQSSARFLFCCCYLCCLCNRLARHYYERGC